MRHPIGDRLVSSHIMSAYALPLIFFGRHVLRLRSVLILFMATLVGCVSNTGESRTRSVCSAACYDTWTARASRTFASARYFKPDTKSTKMSVLVHQFSPLVVQESGWMLPDALAAGGPPIVYVEESRLIIRELVYDQITYRWLVLRDQERNPLQEGRHVGHEKSHEIRGLRITVGQDGFAAVCEVIQPGSLYRRVFVSKSMEEAARKAFSEPLEGRRYAVELSVDLAPHVIVVGVFDDGPIPMGPFVYLDAALNVTAIRCRCSASLVDAFSDESVYEFLPFESMQTIDRNVRESCDKTIVQSLRWPGGF